MPARYGCSFAGQWNFPFLDPPRRVGQGLIDVFPFKAGV